MLSYTISRHCKRDILRPHWSAVCERLTDEQQNRQIAIQISEEDPEESQEEHTEVSRHLLFRSIVYESESDCVTITTAKERGRLSAIYNYVVENPKRIIVFYEQGNQIFAVAITDKANVCMAIHFEDDVSMMYGNPQTLLSPLVGTATGSESVLFS